MISHMFRAAQRRQRINVVLITLDRSRPFGALWVTGDTTQGSQSLTLGLTLIAAPQLDTDSQ
jgi:hypothetical protein